MKTFQILYLSFWWNVILFYLHTRALHITSAIKIYVFKATFVNLFVEPSYSQCEQTNLFLNIFYCYIVYFMFANYNKMCLNFIQLQI